MQDPGSPLTSHGMAVMVTSLRSCVQTAVCSSFGDHLQCGQILGCILGEQPIGLEIAAVLIGNDNIASMAQTEQQTEQSHETSVLLDAMSSSFHVTVAISVMATAAAVTINACCFN